MPLAPLQASIAQLERGEAEAAVRALEKRLERTPLHVTAWVLLARAYEAEARWADARRAWQRACFLLPTSSLVAEGLLRTGEQALASAAAPPAGSDRTESDRTESDRAASDRAASEAALEEEPSSSTPVFPADAPDDLDTLISELDGARIVPRSDLDDLPAPDLDDDLDDLVSETLARIYAAQEQYADAARVYAQLAEQDPARADEHHANAEAMRARAKKG